VRRERRGEGGAAAAPSRRGVGRAPGRRRRVKVGGRPRHHEEGRGGRPRWGRNGPEQEHLRHRWERLRHRERLRRTTVYPEPATTTPSTRCERRLNPLHLFPSLASPLC
jgi:hypothetical protein